MENWFKRLFLTFFLVPITVQFVLHSTIVLAQELPEVINPAEGRIILNESKIKALDTELGATGGVISVQDFGTNAITGFRLAFHLNDYFFIEANQATSTLHKTSFEKLQKGIQLLNEDQRKFSYYDIDIGYNVFQGESFFSANYAFNSAFYLIAGTGSTEFANEKQNTWTYGFGYRVVFLDWLSMHLDTRDHIFESDLFTKNEQFHSISMLMGLSIFF